jgi:SAM-dependent methyltransferase
MGHSTYYDLDAVDAGVSSGQHRELIGGLWEEMGPRQLDLLISRGMTPQSRLLDIGCGSLRLGAVAVPWLEPMRYFGTDLSAALIEAGRSLELDEVGRAKAPAHHFAVNEDFDFGFLVEPVDFAIAQSVFTHLPLNHLRRCMAKLAGKTTSGGKCLVTYFPCPDDADLVEPFAHVSGVVTHDWKDPYHYRTSDLDWAVAELPWRVQPIGDWGHPRGQHVVEFVRL